ncbi:MAG TPA: hypothetical protein GXX29_14080 [Firmicutes bacterium]|nr:hypothetical protein [Bacillota bacterium]
MRLHRFITVLGIMILLVAACGIALAAEQSKPKLIGRGADFVLKGSVNQEKGRTYWTGDAEIIWEEYTITGLAGEIDFNQRILKVTRSAKVVQAPAEEGEDNRLVLIADWLEMTSEGESLTATGNVWITTADMDVKADNLEGGHPSRMKDIVANSMAGMAEAVVAEVFAWMEQAGEDDLIYFLEGNVAGKTPELEFQSGTLLVNANAETFIFAGPTEIIYTAEEESESAGEGGSAGGEDSGTGSEGSSAGSKGSGAGGEGSGAGGEGSGA